LEEILELALKKEQASFRFYDKLLNSTKVSILKDIFEQLRDEESKHIQMIKRKLSSIKLGKG
ncbi:MAG TPA: ferritin family protein, partial [Desulfatiglandales bacterium]|nr:ferritin family protein [Desulfatiglandales bacterium]